MNFRPREVIYVIEPQPVIEGAGVRLKRSIATATLDNLDPFLLFDHFGSKNPADYIKGFPMHPHRGIETVTYMIQGAVDHRDSIGNAGSILYLADNAGEIVFDRVLIEQLSAPRVTLVVRGAPVINDATMIDACAAGLHEIVNVIDNGSDAPGTILEDCSEDFRRRFTEADVVLAKGQGNFETLSDAPREVFFLFKAKCSVIAERAGWSVGSLVLMRSCAEGGGR